MAGRRRVAIVGAGPAGAFAAASLLRSAGDVEIDLFERLPTPWGLLRGGVAPDHQEIKRLEDTFDRQTLGRGCRFLGNVEVGTDVSHSELMRHYTAVVIGNGNVAADVTRVLTLSPTELERTDVADHALEALRESRVEEVIVLGRRGPAQAAFTSTELRELGNLDGVDMRVGRDGVELDPISHRWLEEEGTFTARKNTELLREFAARPARADARRRIELRFLCSPVEIGGTGRVESVDVRRNEIARADDGTLRARPVEGDVETIECGLVLRSVGYRAVPLPDVPFDERSFVLPNERGRVLSPDGEPLPGVYAVGWIKRGPTGILGTNKRDAEETIGRLVEDLRGGRLPDPPDPLREQIDELVAERRPDLVTTAGWRAIDAHELERGQSEQRPRVKLASRDDLLECGATGR